MKKQVFLMFLLLHSILYAKNTTIETEKLQALKTLKKYSETVACSTNFEDGKRPLRAFLGNVFNVERDTVLGGATYYVLWYGDLGCSGGQVQLPTK